MPAGRQRLVGSLLLAGIGSSRGQALAVPCSRVELRRSAACVRATDGLGHLGNTRYGVRGSEGTRRLRRSWETGFTSVASAAGGTLGGASSEESRRRTAGSTRPASRGEKASEGQRIIEQSSVCGSWTHQALRYLATKRTSRAAQQARGHAVSTAGHSTAASAHRHADGTTASAVGSATWSGRRLRSSSGRAVTERQEGNGCGDAVRLLARGILRGV